MGMVVDRMVTHVNGMLTEVSADEDDDEDEGGDAAAGQGSDGGSLKTGSVHAASADDGFPDEGTLVSEVSEI